MVYSEIRKDAKKSLTKRILAQEGLTNSQASKEAEKRLKMMEGLSKKKFDVLKIWCPSRNITRDGETFIYVGDIPNTPSSKRGSKEYNSDNGRKTSFVTDKNNKRTACMYVSSRFYKSLCKVQSPCYGIGRI